MPKPREKVGDLHLRIPADLLALLKEEAALNLRAVAKEGEAIIKEEIRRRRAKRALEKPGPKAAP